MIWIKSLSLNTSFTRATSHGCLIVVDRRKYFGLTLPVQVEGSQTYLAIEKIPYFLRQSFQTLPSNSIQSIDTEISSMKVEKGQCTRISCRLKLCHEKLCRRLL